MVTANKANELITELGHFVYIKQQYKDLDMVIHEIATKLALKYLKKIYPEIKTWGSNPRAEAGIDTFGLTQPTQIKPQVVAEVTAHDPIRRTRGGDPRFGSKQRQKMQEIISKLLQEKQAKKYLFVISEVQR